MLAAICIIGKEVGGAWMVYGAWCHLAKLKGGGTRVKGMANGRKVYLFLLITMTILIPSIHQVANLACSMSVNPEKVKMVRLAAKRLQNLCPQVINAARTLAARPHSKVARENMDVFKEAWEKQLQVLTEAVDDITSIDEFLATTGELNGRVL